MRSTRPNAPSSDSTASDSMGPALGIGVVGAGYWGPRLVRNFQAAEGSRVVAVCDRDAESLARVTRSNPGVEGVSSIEALLARSDVDAVAIATPVCTHFDLAKKALRSGRHVLVEKPMAATSAEAEELCEIAEARELTLLVDHTFVYHPAVHRLQRAVADGDLGKLLYFDSVRANLGLFQPDVNVLWDLAPHDLSILTSLRPEMPVTVTAVGASHWGPGTENIAYLTLRYADSFLAHIHASWLAPVKIRRTTVCGDRKMLIYDDTQVVEKIKVYDRGFSEALPDVASQYAQRVEYRTGDVHSPHISNEEPLASEVADFLRCIRTGDAPLSTGRSGLDVVRILELAQESIRREGHPVRADGRPDLDELRAPLPSARGRARARTPEVRS